MRVFLQIVVLAVLVGGAALFWLSGGNGQPTAGPGRGGPGGGMPSPVEVATVELGPIRERVEAVGTARARESVDIVADQAGRIATIAFEEGQRVEAGTLLVEMEAERERAELREAEARRDDARQQFERAQRLLPSRSVAAARVEELQAALAQAEARVAVVESRLRERQIRAPFAGIVGLRQVSPGAFVNPQQLITTLDDLSTVRVEFRVPERFLGQLRRDLAVAARSAAYPEVDFVGAVSELDTRVDPATRTVRVQSVFGNPDGSLRPGMFLAIELVLSERQAPRVPEESLILEGNSRYVFVVEDGAARRVEVSTGLRGDGLVEITDGLSAGQRVVTAGQPRLRDGAPVRVLGDPPPGGAGPSGPPTS